jgi:hypothetical protein
MESIQLLNLQALKRNSPVSIKVAEIKNRDHSQTFSLGCETVEHYQTPCQLKGQRIEVDMSSTNSDSYMLSISALLAESLIKLQSIAEPTLIPTPTVLSSGLLDVTTTKDLGLLVQEWYSYIIDSYLPAQIDDFEELATFLDGEYDSLMQTRISIVLCLIGVYFLAILAIIGWLSVKAKSRVADLFSNYSNLKVTELVMMKQTMYSTINFLDINVLNEIAMTDKYLSVRCARNAASEFKFDQDPADAKRRRGRMGGLSGVKGLRSVRVLWAYVLSLSIVCVLLAASGLSFLQWKVKEKVARSSLKEANQLLWALNANWLKYYAHGRMQGEVVQIVADTHSKEGAVNGAHGDRVGDLISLVRVQSTQWENIFGTSNKNRLEKLWSGDLCDEADLDRKDWCRAVSNQASQKGILGILQNQKFIMDNSEGTLSGDEYFSYIQVQIRAIRRFGIVLFSHSFTDVISKFLSASHQNETTILLILFEATIAAVFFLALPALFFTNYFLTLDIENGYFTFWMIDLSILTDNPYLQNSLKTKFKGNAR